MTNEFLPRSTDFLHSLDKSQNLSVSPEGIRTLSMLLQAGIGKGLEGYPRVSDPVNALKRRSRSSVPNLSWANGAWAVKGKASPEELAILSFVRTLSGETGSQIPSQTYLDEWVREKSFNILKRHAPVSPTLPFLLSNVLALDLKWDEPFDVMPVRYTSEESGMSFWGRESVLATTVNEPTLYVYHGHIFGVLRKTSQAGKGRFVVTSIIGQPEMTIQEVYKVLLSGEARPLSAEEIKAAPYHYFYSWKEVASTSPDTMTSVLHPAWESSNTHTITDEVIQQVVVKYDALGFKAAALTMMARGMPMFTDRALYVNLNFCNTFFVFAQYEEEGSVWDKEVLFMSKVNVASEA